jgi:hypothetical protein
MRKMVITIDTYVPDDYSTSRIDPVGKMLARYTKRAIPEATRVINVNINVQEPGQDTVVV